MTSGELAQGRIHGTRESITTKALAETSVKLWPVGTLLVAMYGEGKTRGMVGELAIQATTNQACAAIVLDDNTPMMRDWIRLVLDSRYEEMRRHANGGVQPNLSLSHFRQMMVPVPPADMRVAAAATARDARDRADILRRAVSEAQARSSSLRRALLAAAFSGRLTGRSSDLDLIEEAVS